jgi:Flp pilus assembly protein TadD
MTVLLCLGLAASAVTLARAQGATGAKVAGKSSAAAPARVAVAKPAPAAAADSLPPLEKAVAKDSTRFDDLYRLGVTYLDRDKVDEAIKVLTKAHALRPADHRVSVNLGAALDASGRPVLAQGYYREVLAQFPGDSVAACRLASSLYSQSKYAEATGLLREIIKKSPQAFCAYFTLGVAFADAGIYKEAIRMWNKVVELAPTSPEAVSARESIDVLEKFVSQ